MIQSVKTLFWQCGGTVDGMIARLIIAFGVGAILIAAGSISLVLHFAAWPFDWTRQLCTRVVRELNINQFRGTTP